MDTFDRNVAIVGSVLYGVLLVCGMLLLLCGSGGEPLYRHPSPKVAIFAVFWLAFSPSLLFIGGTVPWVCALCRCRAAALTFAIVPGGICVLVGAYCLTLYDRPVRSYGGYGSGGGGGGAAGVPSGLPWQQRAMTYDGYRSAGTAPYYGVDVARQLYPGTHATGEMAAAAGGPPLGGGYPPLQTVLPPPWMPGASREMRLDDEEEDEGGRDGVDYGVASAAYPAAWAYAGRGYAAATQVPSRGTAGFHTGTHYDPLRFEGELPVPYSPASPSLYMSDTPAHRQQVQQQQQRSAHYLA